MSDVIIDDCVVVGLVAVVVVYDVVVGSEAAIVVASLVLADVLIVFEA